MKDKRDFNFGGGFGGAGCGVRRDDRNDRERGERHGRGSFFDGSDPVIDRGDDEGGGVDRTGGSGYGGDVGEAEEPGQHLHDRREGLRTPRPPRKGEIAETRIPGDVRKRRERVTDRSRLLCVTSDLLWITSIAAVFSDPVEGTVP